MEAHKVAVIDLGTNTFNLLLAKLTSSAYYIFYNEKIAVKIGKDGINQGIITESAQQRALDALIQYKTIIDLEGITKIYGFATSAFRNAKNGRQFRDLIEQKTSLPIDIISGEAEAEYIYHGVKTALDIGRKDALILDIGGGSIEFIIGNKYFISWKKSFEIGAQRLLDWFHREEPIPLHEINSLENYFEQQLTPLDQAISEYNPEILIGSSGTFDTLSDIYCERIGIEIKSDQTEFPLDLEEYYKIHTAILTMNREERLLIPGMIEMRVDMIVVASLLVNYILKKYHFKKIRVSSHSLKEGMLQAIQRELFDGNDMIAFH